MKSNALDHPSIQPRRSEEAGSRASSRMASFGVLLLTATLAAADGVAGQTLTGRTLEDGRGTPVAGASVSLVDREGEAKAHAMSDGLGRFQIRPPEAGEYYLVVEQLSYAPHRSPLLALSVDGSVAIEIVMAPLPLGIEGIEVSVEEEATELLQNFGKTPAALGKQWIDRGEIDRMVTPGTVKDVIRWQNISGVSVDEQPPLCVRFQRRDRACSITVLDGVVVPAEMAFDLDARDIEAIAILDPTDAVTFYGTAAGGGAVLFWTRRGR